MCRLSQGAAFGSPTKVKQQMKPETRLQTSVKTNALLPQNSKCATWFRRGGIAPCKKPDCRPYSLVRALPPLHFQGLHFGKGDTVLFCRVGKPVTAVFDGALLRREVHIHNSETPRVTLSPLEIVHE